MALAQEVELEPYGRVSVAYLTLATRSRAEALALADRYQDWAVLERAVELARRQNELALRQLELDTPELARMQQVLALLLYPHASLRASADRTERKYAGPTRLVGLRDFRRSPHSARAHQRCRRTAAGAGTAAGAYLLARPADEH